MSVYAGSLLREGGVYSGSLIVSSDSVAPVFDISPFVTSITSASVSLSFTVNENANVYFIAVPFGSDAPTNSQIIAGVDYGSVIVASSRSVTAQGSVVGSTSLTGLSQDTQYTVYSVAVDGFGNESLQQSLNIRTNGTVAADSPVMPADIGVVINSGSVNVGAFRASAGTAPITYTISGTDSALFSINSTTAELTFNTAPDFLNPSDSGADNIYNLVVTATNTQGSDSQNVTVTVISSASFWSKSVSPDFIIEPHDRIDKDPNSTRIFWVNFGDALSGFTIVSCSIDPDSKLPAGAPSFSSSGVNTSQATDSEGNTYEAGKLFGVTVSGGNLGEVYSVVFRYSLSSGEVDEGTIHFSMIDL